jgi:hypothetical protein
MEVSAPTERRSDIRIFAFGTGPGPKNVGIEFDDGTRTVVVYRTYKYRYQQLIGGSLSDGKVYETVRGIVQFEPKTRDVNGKEVVDIAIRDRGSDGQSKLINITIWPEFLLSQPVQRGDFIAADGSVEARTYQDKEGASQTSIQLSAFSLVHVPQVKKAERQVVQQSGATSTQASPF